MSAPHNLAANDWSGRWLTLDASDGLTVTEVARLLGTTVRALRYYEDAHMLHPDRSPGNARRYGPAARTRAAIIVALRRANVPLEGMKAATAGQEFDEDSLVDLLEERLAAAKTHVSDIARLLAAAKSGTLAEL